jgi:hypothetical protein
MNLLGMKRKLLPLGSPQGGKGGGGGGAPPPPASQTVTQTAIPEYARPYVESMLGKSEALTDINQNPYQSYGGQRIAGFNPVQERAFQNVQNMQTAPQLGQGTALAGASGLGSLGAGARYQNMATDPNAMAAYMSPYMQNVVDIQKDQAVRDAQIRNLGANLASASSRQGTYGGARQLLAEQERNRNLQQGLANIQATGSQNAFQAAQQAQQFGTTAGLQGYGQAGQAAATLGNLGQTQFGQESAINQAQQQVGAIQQAQAQQGLDLGYQDFLKQRNYPYQQLAFQSDMLRGIPLSQSAQQIYTAPPSTASQLGGLGMSALGIYGMSGGFKAKGGAIKEMAEGGLAYAKGGDIKTMSTEQLTEMLDNPNLNPLERDLIEQQLMIRRRMEMNPETDQIMNQAMRTGIGSIATGDMVPENMAGGGIVAFSKGGDNKGVDAIKSAAESRQSYRDQLEREVLESMKRLKTEDPFKESRAQDEKIRAQMAESKRVAPYEALTMAGLRTMAGTSPYALANLGGGGEEGLKAYARSARDQSDLQKQLLQQGVEREKAQFGRQTQLLGAQQTALGQLYGKEAEIERAKAAKANAGALQAGTLYNQLSSQYMTAVSREMETLRKRYKDQFNMDKTEAELESEAVANVTKRLPPQARKTLFGDQVIPDATPAPAVPAPAPAAGAKTFNVVVNGKTFSFPTKEAADTFKKRAKESDPKATIQ